MQINDILIYDLLKQRNPRGMELLFKYYYRPLVLSADTLLNNIPASEDLVQDFLVSFWENKTHARITPQKLRGYIFVSIKNQSLKLLAKQDPLKNSTPVLYLSVESYDSDDLTEERLQAIEAEIEKLPPRTKDVVLSVYKDGLSYQDTADRLNVSISTVKTLLVNSLKRLRETLGAV